ncbi:MAG: YbaB/EbfC family nucleoid-associated protein [Alphaproteobacteria bacterium]|nr:YbaB/EbfC family nucleoid-associated protein [Alphaproteobacteria bacterium]
MNIAGMMKKAQEMQKKLQEAQENLVNIIEEGSAGAGMVTVSMNGKTEVKKITISEELLTPNDKEMLEDLLVAALSDAKRKIDTRAGSEMEKVTGGLGLPGGMKLPF